MSSSGEVSPASVTPATTPSLQGTHAPKYGTVIPNRIFVGGIAANTTAQELKQFFSSYGAVQESKIITDRAGISKGYGFITFETLEDAEKIIKKEADNLVFKDRKLNIGPAIKKQAFPRVYDQLESSSKPSVSPGSVMFSNGVPYTYQNGMAIFHPQDGGYQCVQPQVTPQTPAYPMMMPSQPMFVSQPGYAYQSPTAAPAAQWTAAAAQSQWRWTAQSPAAALAYPAYPTIPPTVTPDMYGHAATSTYPQQADLDASMMEAAPAEGSMVMDPMRPAYVDPTLGTAAIMQPPPATVSTATAHSDHHAHQQQLVQQAAANMAGPAAAAAAVYHHRTPVAYKRPLPQSSRKIMGTPTVSLSPRATPPSKVLITHQRMMSHMGPPLTHGDLYDVVHQPLTPPPTPESLGHV